jgi:hypothetical protein
MRVEMQRAGALVQRMAIERECRIKCVTSLSQAIECYTRRFCGMKGQDHG